MRFDSSTASCSWQAHLKAWFGSWIWLDREESHQKPMTSDPSSNPMNYVKFTVVVAASIVAKQYLEDQSILLAKKWSMVLR